MPELLDPGAADDIETSEVSAVGAAPTMAGIGNLGGHAANLSDARLTDDVGGRS